jgi:hypothetical protein
MRGHRILNTPAPIRVHPARIALSDPAGPIPASYSADRISDGRPIREPFEHGGNLWCCISISGKSITTSGEYELEAYRLLPVEMFTGTPTTYTEKLAIDNGDAARGDPKGFYDSISVSFRNNTYILAGPPATFIASSEPVRPDVAQTEQLTLFAMEVYP